MRCQRARSVTFSLLLTAGLLAFACTSADTEPDNAASEELAALFEEVWAETVSDSPFLRMREGLPVETLNDPSFEAYQEDLVRARGWLERLQSLDLEALDHSEWVHAKALEWDLETTIEGERWFWHDSVMTPYMSPLSMLAQLYQSRPVTTPEQRTEYLDLLRQLPDWIRKYEGHIRGQAERGVYVWRENLEPSIAVLEANVAGDGFGPFGVAEERLENAEGETDEFVREVLGVVSDEIDPAFRALIEFLQGNYAGQTFPAVGAAELPDGDEYYRYAVRRSTTMDVTPQEVHERGLALVEEMEADMRALRDQIGFEGTREEFHAQIKSNPDYYPESPDEVAERLMDAAEAMEEVVGEFFMSRPVAGYGVRRLEPELEGTLTYGIYRPPTGAKPEGHYMYNGSKLDERNWLNLRAVSLHELIPGHHFHIARQGENQDLPDYRRNQWHTAYTEGWGSYSSWLGREAGVYDGDPLSEYGMYILEIFLATRLVVDTGMSALGWSLEQGREFMREHTLESETQIGTESVRYSADMPAQALAYQMGKLELLRLRRHAEAELGDAFDLRAFHEALLEHGSLPMAVLGEHINWWIAQQKGGG